MVQIFDGHNDFLYRLWEDPAAREALFLGTGTTGAAEGLDADVDRGHLDLPRMKAANFAGGMFAIFAPSPALITAAERHALRQTPPYDMALPDPLNANEALAVAMAQAGHFRWMERASGGQFRGCQSVEDIRGAMAAGAVAGVLHLEGCEPISADLDALHVFYAMGLRSLGPVWSRPNIFGHGVPFRFPGDPDIGPGLTPEGRALLRECNQLGVLFDLSHLNAAGFRDVMAVSDAPLVATHSNAWEVSQSPRNLTDWQLDAIRETDGMVGLNFAAFFLRPDGREDLSGDWDPILRHLDHLIERLGETRVGFGSDFDGAQVPDVIGDVTGLPGLIGALKAHGYGQELITRLAHENWLRVLGKTWHEAA